MLPLETLSWFFESGMSIGSQASGYAPSLIILLWAFMCKCVKDTEAVEVFYRMIDEGAIPNSRTYTIMIEHLMNSRKSDSAMEVFNILSLMRIRHTLKQYLKKP